MSTVSHKSNLYRHLIGRLLGSTHICGAISLALARLPFVWLPKYVELHYLCFSFYLFWIWIFCCVFITGWPGSSPSCHPKKTKRKKIGTAIIPWTGTGVKYSLCLYTTHAAVVIAAFKHFVRMFCHCLFYPKPEWAGWLFCVLESFNLFPLSP